jgi:aryl-alcohol dehydrogenase-like predicted oxidoreductase
MTLWDTADTYCPDDGSPGHNEELIGAALKALPSSLKDRVVIASKGGYVREGRFWTVDGRPNHLRQSIDSTLRRLGATEIGLYQLHRPDPKTPLSDSIGAIIEAREAGKIRAIGLSNVTAEQIDEARMLTSIDSIQNCFNIYNREVLTNGVLNICRLHKIAFLPYCPFGGMSLAKNLGKTACIATATSRLGITAHQYVLAWMLSLYENLIPIPGCSHLSSVEDCAGAADINVDASVLADMNANAV